MYTYIHKCVYVYIYIYICLAYRGLPSAWGEARPSIHNDNDNTNNDNIDNNTMI